MVPNDLTITASLTYQQVRDEKKTNGGFFLRLIGPNKDSMDSKMMFSWINNESIGSLPNVFSEMFEAQRCDDSFKERRNISF